jgi:hypothetical protein
MATILLILSAQHVRTAITIGGDRENEWSHSSRSEADHFVLHRMFGRELRQTLDDGEVRSVMRR